MEVYLQKAIQMDNMDSFESLLKWYNLIGRFLNPIKDGHLFVRRDMTISSIQTTYLPEFYADAETKFVNDTLLIRTGINDKQSWRILYTINDRPASACLQDARLITNAATDSHRDQMAADKLFSSTAYDAPFVILSSDLSGNMRKDTLLPNVLTYQFPAVSPNPSGKMQTASSILTPLHPS